jgi:tetratricopeptide (TPR) repeat protein
MHGRLSFLASIFLLFSCLPVAVRGITPVATIRRPGPETAGSNIYQSSVMSNTDMLSSPSVGNVFFELAYEMANTRDIGNSEVEQAIIFLKAALELDRNNPAVRPLLIDLACRDTNGDYSDLVYNSLLEYVDEFADLEIARKAVYYLLERQNSVEERQKMLETMLGNIANRNNVLGSELATLLGLLNAEKPDLEAAEYYLVQAYKNNRYNKEAFAKLAELAPEQIEPALLLERLRLALRENPVDIDAAIVFAQRAEQLQLYDVAADAYQYCAELFTYLYPSEILSSRIYIPWSISCYNSQKNQSKSLEIAERVRRTGKFDLRLESIAGRAAAVKLGNGELATQIIQDAEQKARQIIMRNQKQNSQNTLESVSGNLQQVDPTQMAWFYCFVVPLENQALTWAQQAFNTQQNSPAAKSLMAYALVLNKEYETAKPLLKTFESNQISDLALALIQLAEGQKNLAFENLRVAISKDPGSFAAERAKEILTQQGQKYSPPVDPESVLRALENTFGQAIVPPFTRPEQIISVEFGIRGSDFSYGSEFEGVASIVNNSQEPLVITDDGLFTGSIRVDAEITGDLRMKIPNLISKRVRTTLLIEPGRSLFIPLRLVTGTLKDTLERYPQASLDIEFALYVDPVRNAGEPITNKLTYITPKQVRIQRPGVRLTTQMLSDRLNNLVSPGRIEDKIKTAELFTGLLKEQYAFSDRIPPYNLMYAEGMTDLLKTGLTHEYGLLLNPSESLWPVKLYTMAYMRSLPLDYGLISAVSENLNNAQWPVRLMALYLLAENPEGGFEKVLDWVAKNDLNNYVRDMAILLNSSRSGQMLLNPTSAIKNFQ